MLLSFVAKKLDSLSPEEVEVCWGLTIPTEESSMRYLLKNRRRRVYDIAVLCWGNGSIVGWSCTCLMGSYVLLSTFVAPDHRRKGIGAELLRQIHGYVGCVLDAKRPYVSPWDDTSLAFFSAVAPNLCLSVF